MKVLGLSCGRKMGNTEILLKEALMGAEEASGAAAELIRLQELTVKPCTGCESCMKSLLKGGSGECVQKNDHMPFLIERLAESEGVILGAPTYELLPPGLLMLIANRMLGCGVAYRGKTATKAKIGAVINVGGTDWVNWVLPVTRLCLHMLAATGLKFVDQMLVTYVPSPGHVLLREEALARARSLGRNVGEAMNLPPDQVKYVGQEEEICPLCHSNLLQVRGKSVVCPICDIEGKLELGGDRVSVAFSEEQLQKSRWGVWGRKRHHDEIMQGHREWNERKQETTERAEKYKSYKPEVSPPRLKRK